MGLATCVQSAGNRNPERSIGHQGENKSHLNTAAVTMSGLAAAECDRSKDKKNEQSII